MADKQTQLKRIGGAPGSGVGAATGLGTYDIVVPEFPKLPMKLTEDSVAEFNSGMERWRSALQAQLPVPWRVTPSDSALSTGPSGGSTTQ